MERPQTLEIDQALFGYSDGHRELAASIRLSPKDMYELAARSDLVPGTQLDVNESYLVGFCLPESRIFALIRTWLAPEMPRPGCVWSHVLLLPKTFLASQVDLGILETLFVRPDGSNVREHYSQKLNVHRLAKAVPPEVALMARLLVAYYDPGEVSLEVARDRDSYRAALALWSQQWPRLRSEFEFKTALDLDRNADPGSRSVSGNLRLDRADAAEEDLWLPLAVEDAVARTVTPLRRFLWRYGKDFKRPRQAFKDLVKLYGESRHSVHGMNAAQISWIIKDAAGRQNAVTLKRDLLGVISSTPALIPRIVTGDYVDVIAGLKPVQRGLVSNNELAEAVSSFASDDIPSLAAALDRFGWDESVDLKIVSDTIVGNITTDSFLDPAMPKTFVMRVLRQRPELIQACNLDIIRAADAVELLELVDDAPTQGNLIARIFAERPVGQSSSRIFTYPSLALHVAAEMHASGKLHHRWQETLSSQVNRIASAGTDDLAGIQNVSHAIQLLDFPIYAPVDASVWAQAAKRDGNAGSSADRIVVDAFVMVLSTRAGVAESLPLIAEVLPRLRQAAFANAFPSKVRSFLDKHLPDVSDSWDFNKRLLKVLRRAARDGADVSSVVNLLSLTEEEAAYALDVSDDESRFNLARLFWPW